MGRVEEHEQVLRAPNLLPEIMEEILSRLPVKSLVRFRCVSKKWRTLLTMDSNFIQKHLSRTLENGEKNTDYILQVGSESNFYYVPDGTFENFVKFEDSPNVHGPFSNMFGVLHMVGSSNGLICISHYYHDSYGEVIYLWNPATRQHRLLPPPLYQRKFPLDVTLGFGFHPIINDYKVVRLVLPKGRKERGRDVKHGMSIEVEIYSLNTNSWRKLGVFPYVFCQSMSMTNINGVVHWVASRGSAHRVDKELILSFDLADEMFDEVPLPDNLNRMGSMYLRMFKGCLSLFVTCKAEEGEGIDVWIMKEYNVKESWAKLFTVESKGLFYPIELLKNGEILLLKELWTLASYNSERREFKKLQSPELETQSNKDVAPYVESLVPVLVAPNQDEGQHAYGPSNQKKERNVAAKKRKVNVIE